jgi:hypothetical protein
MDRGQNYITEQADLGKLSLYLRNSSAEATEATLHIEAGDVTAKTEPLIEAKAQVPPGDWAWVEFALPTPLPPLEPHFVWLEKNPALTWRICENAEGTRTWRTGEGWTIVEGLYALKPYSSSRSLGNVDAESAANGLKWPLAGEGNLWRSDPAKGLPAWLEIDFGKPTSLNTVYLTFDTNIYGRFPVGTVGTEILAEDYRVLVHRGDSIWEAVVEETGNWHRFRRHAFEATTTDKLRLDILRARGGFEARVYEVRAYQE